MSTPRLPLPGKLILSVLGSNWDLFWPDLNRQLRECYGPFDYESEQIPFTETSYYDQELGTPIYRRFIAFEHLLPLERLPEIKTATNALENAAKINEKRIFNLDPGFITHERLVLATGKNFTHRIYLGKKIWADLTLIFTRGDWQNLPWTFPDYASEKTKIHLRRIREIYCGQIKKREKLPA